MLELQGSSDGAGSLIFGDPKTERSFHAGTKPSTGSRRPLLALPRLDEVPPFGRLRGDIEDQTESLEESNALDVPITRRTDRPPMGSRSVGECPVDDFAPSVAWYQVRAGDRSRIVHETTEHGVVSEGPSDALR